MSASLTARQRVLLMTLMAVNDEVSNPVLKKRTGLSLERADRVRLAALGLVTSVKRGRCFWYELADEGWAWCARELSGPVPQRSDTGTRGLYALMAGLNRYLARADLRLSDVFGEIAEMVGAEPDGQEGQDDLAGRELSLAERIRAAYRELASQPGDWVSLTPVRGLLNDVPRAEVDQMLRLLEREPDVHLAPETAQFDLTPADRAAAVRIGGKDNHLLKVGGTRTGPAGWRLLLPRRPRARGDLLGERPGGRARRVVAPAGRQRADPAAGAARRAGPACRHFPDGEGAAGGTPPDPRAARPVRREPVRAAGGVGAADP